MGQTMEPIRKRHLNMAAVKMTKGMKHVDPASCPLLRIALCLPCQRRIQESDIRIALSFHSGTFIKCPFLILL